MEYRMEYPMEYRNVPWKIVWNIVWNIEIFHGKSYRISHGISKYSMENRMEYRMEHRNIAMDITTFPVLWGSEWKIGRSSHHLPIRNRMEDWKISPSSHQQSYPEIDRAGVKT